MITDITIIKPVSGGTRISYLWNDRESEYFTRQDITERVAEIILNQLPEDILESNIIESIEKHHRSEQYEGCDPEYYDN